MDPDAYNNFLNSWLSKPYLNNKTKAIYVINYIKTDKIDILFLQ